MKVAIPASVTKDAGSRSKECRPKKSLRDGTEVVASAHVEKLIDDPIGSEIASFLPEQIDLLWKHFAKRYISPSQDSGEDGEVKTGKGGERSTCLWDPVLPGRERVEKRFMASKITTLNLKWKAFRNFFDFAPTDAELARGAFGLGEDNGAQTFSKMLSGDQGVPLEILQVMAERINRQATAHRALRSVREPLGDGAINAIDLAESSLFDFVRKLVALSPSPDTDRLDQLHRDLIDALAPQPNFRSDLVRFKIERSSAERSFAPFMPESDEGSPTVFEPGRHFGQFSISDQTVSRPDAPAFVYVFLRRDTAPIGKRVWDQRFPETLLWLASPFLLKTVDGIAQLFPQPVPVLPEPGRYRAVAVIVRDLQALRRIDPRLDPRKTVEEVPPPARFGETASIRFLTNVGRIVEKKDKDPAIDVTMADYLVVMPSAEAV